MIIKGEPENPLSAFNPKIEYKQFEYVTHESSSPLTAEYLNQCAENIPADKAGPWRLAHFAIGPASQYPNRTAFYYIFEREHHVIEYCEIGGKE